MSKTCINCAYNSTAWASDKYGEVPPKDMSLIKENASPVLGSLYGKCQKGKFDNMHKTYNEKETVDLECFEQTEHSKNLDEIVNLLDKMIHLVDIKNRTTPENINTLKKGQIFTFGSNQSGKHGKGAAKQALGWGAIWGQAEGLQGKTYGIPTKDKSVRRVLSIVEIKPYVDRFIEFAVQHPDLVFLVTEVGCGLSKMKPKDIAPLFEKAIDVENIHLPKRFWHKLTKTK